MPCQLTASKPWVFERLPWARFEPVTCQTGSCRLTQHMWQGLGLCNRARSNIMSAAFVTQSLGYGFQPACACNCCLLFAGQTHVTGGCDLQLGGSAADCQQRNKQATYECSTEHTHNKHSRLYNIASGCMWQRMQHTCRHGTNGDKLAHRDFQK